MDRRFDLVVIGTGAAAFSPAHRCREAGWSVAVVDRRPYGGTCALRGCNPKKVLVGAAELADRVRRMAGKGLSAPGLRVDWPALMRFKRTFTEPVPGRVERGFRREGIETLHGAARFTGPASLQVGPDRLAARRVLIAAGSVPARLGFPGEELLATQRRVPRARRAAPPHRVRRRRLHLLRAGPRRGLRRRRGRHPAPGAAPPFRVRPGPGRPAGGGEPRARHRGGAGGARGGGGGGARPPGGAGRGGGGRARRFEADLAVHGAGRVADLEELELETAGVRHGRKGVEVDALLRSVSNPAVFAAGDAAASGAPQLTPVAGLEGEVAADNLLAGGPPSARPRARRHGRRLPGPAHRGLHRARPGRGGPGGGGGPGAGAGHPGERRGTPRGGSPPGASAAARPATSSSSAGRTAACWAPTCWARRPRR